MPRYDRSDRFAFTDGGGGGVGVDELGQFAVGSRHQLTIKGDRVTVGGKPVQRAPSRP